MQTLEGHAQNVSCVSFHPELPIIITGSEDGNLGFSGVERKEKGLGESSGGGVAAALLPSH